MTRLNTMAGIAFLLGVMGAVIAQPARGSQETPPQATDVPALIRTASDTNSDVFSIVRSVFLLARTPENPDVQKCLIELFKSDQLPTHTLAALSIGYAKNKSLTEQVVPFLKSDKAWQRREAAWVLGRDPERGKRFIKQLIATLKDDDWEVRMYAAWALGRLEAKEAVPVLRDIVVANKGKQSGVEAETAIVAIEKGAYRPRINTPAPWIVVPDVDIPRQALKIGTIMTITGETKADDFLFGVFHFASQEGTFPLKVSILGGIPWMLVFYGGNGKITDIWTKTSVPVSGEYHKEVRNDKD